MGNQKINGIEYDFSTVTVTIDGTTYKSIQNINWTVGQDHQVVYGAGPLPVGVTPGTFNGTGSFELLLSDYKGFAASLTDMMQTYFDIQCVYSLGGLSVITEDLTKCIMTGNSGNNATGSAALTRSVDFIMLNPPKVDKKSMTSDDADILGTAFRLANLGGSLANLF